MAKKQFLAYPNPFIHLDHDGYPAGACPCDMPEHVGMTTRKWVGASLDGANTFLLEKLSAEERLYRDPRQQTRWSFNLSEPTVLPVTEYYRDRLRAGELFPADEDTARACGVPFVKLSEALAASKAAALQQWQAENGPDNKPEGVDSLDAALSPKAAAKLAKTTPPSPTGAT